MRTQLAAAFEEWEQFLDRDHMPRALNRDVTFADIRTTDEAAQYIRRFYHGAVERGLRQPFGTPLRVIWADIAREYAIAHNELAIGVNLDEILAKVARADIRSAEALVAERGGPLPRLPPTAEPPRGSGFAPKRTRRGGLAVAGILGALTLSFVFLRPQKDDPLF